MNRLILLGSNSGHQRNKFRRVNFGYINGLWATLILRKDVFTLKLVAVSLRFFYSRYALYNRYTVVERLSRFEIIKHECQASFFTFAYKFVRFFVINCTSFPPSIYPLPSSPSPLLTMSMTTDNGTQWRRGCIPSANNQSSVSQSNVKLNWWRIWCQKLIKMMTKRWQFDLL